MSIAKGEAQRCLGARGGWRRDGCAASPDEQQAGCPKPVAPLC